MLKSDLKKTSNGRGTGTGTDYVPYIKIQEARVHSRKHRIQGRTVGRVHHLLSDVEANVFRVFDWMPNVIDIREQFPLDRAETLKIAEVLNIPHPRHGKEKEEIVMTTDFMLTVMQSGREVPVVRTVKTAAQLSHDRTLAKVEIERAYFERREIDWAIITEKQIPGGLVFNLTNLQACYSLDGYGLGQPEIAAARSRLEQHILHDGSIVPSRAGLAIDTQIGLPAGSTLTVLYHMLITRQWGCDMTVPIEPGRPLAVSIGSHTGEVQRAH